VEEVRIDWGAASVDGGRLTVPLAGKPPAGFERRLAARTTKTTPAASARTRTSG
jgi:hypothetical protein